MWYISGAVMMYVPFPSLTAAERQARLAPIDWSKVEGAAVADETLRQGLDAPVWLGDGTATSAGGDLLASVSAERAKRAATAFGRAPVTDIEQIERDQWTVAGGYDRSRPLWKVTLDRPDGLILYVASTTGAVVLDTSRTERLWNWLGSVPHWIYPTVLRQNAPLWRQVILWTSGLAIVGAVSGMWIGVLRMRLRRRYRDGRATPYRGWQWLHHVVGLTAGTFLATWIVSGWLSVDPNRWFASEGLSEEARGAYATAGKSPTINWQRLGRLPQAAGARELRLLWSDGTPLLLLSHRRGEESVLDARTLRPVVFTPERLKRAAERLFPSSPEPDVDRLTQSDAYWYQAKGKVEVPVWRFRFTDPARTWVYVSPRSGAILRDVDTRARVYRWLFDGLHRWDFDGLIARRPLWDAWMWLWLTMGTAVSVSGVVIGYRRLRTSLRKPASGIPSPEAFA